MYIFSKTVENFATLTNLRPSVINNQIPLYSAILGTLRKYNI